MIDIILMYELIIFEYFNVITEREKREEKRGTGYKVQ